MLVNMERTIESKSLTKELEKVVENKLADEQQCTDTNNTSKCLDEVEEENKNETNEDKGNSNKIDKIENNGEPVLDSEPSIEAQKDISCSVSKDAVHDGNDNQEDSTERTDGQTNLNQEPDNIAAEEIGDDKNEIRTEVESDDQNPSNQGAEEVEAGNIEDENKSPVQNTDQAATSSNQTQIREQCRYGSQCYRLNAEHKAKFSHPGDADYNDPDNRPECPYGVQCYRKNPQHRLDYKHTITKRKRTKNTMQTVSLDDLSDFEESMEESVDESDEYDGSFIDDDELDDDFESDFESDELDEENNDNDNSEDEAGQKNKKKRIKNQTKGKKKKKAKNN